MGCFKTLTLSGGCVLETCETKDAVIMGPNPYPVTAYSPDHCYCLVLYNDTAFTTSYLGRYDPATNTVIQKVDIGSYYTSDLVYDSTAEKFVMIAGTDVLTFDPTTETTDTFATGVTGTISALIDVPEKGRVYGVMGVNGSNERYIGYIDMNLQTVVQLGVFPAIGAGRPRPVNMAYSPVVNALYGNWASGATERLCRFDLTTNIGSYIVIGLTGARSLWDSSRNLLLMVFGSLWEYDTATDAITTTVAQGPDFSMRSADFIDDSNQLWGWGRDSVTGNDGIVKINLTTQVWTQDLVDYQYGELTHFAGGSAIVPLENLAFTEGGLRKVCLT